ncbi:hypothetical protein PV328_002948 [Microctonus aethiopoides]|uniref:Uncharacterized protein n=1 Tax=Microctonus aethiopoides TaxID=144406 RepID=A0AA39KK11_9HYME|nr:hypothetical protein PV328_002948 [Microctonus aethiopoides]
MAKFFVIILHILFGSSIAIELSSIVPVCGRRNPNLDECVKNSFNSLRPKLIKGIPELDVPSIEPLTFEYSLPITNLNGIKANISNIKLYNASTYEIQNIHVDFENKKIECLLHFNKMKLVADYELSAKILVQIEGKGSIELNIDDAELKTTLGYTIKDSKKGEKFYFTSATNKLKMKDFQTRFSSLVQEGSNTAVINESIDEVLNSNHREIAISVIPGFEKALAAKILTIGNKIANIATYDEIFPDRE